MRLQKPKPMHGFSQVNKVLPYEIFYVLCAPSIRIQDKKVGLQYQYYVYRSHAESVSFTLQDFQGSDFAKVREHLLPWYEQELLVRDGWERLQIETPVD